MLMRRRSYSHNSERVIAVHGKGEGAKFLVCVCVCVKDTLHGMQAVKLKNDIRA